MPGPPRPLSDARAWVEVDLGALVRNARALAAHARVPLVPMVKADAYGLGAVRVARALEAVAPFAYGVSSIPEAIELRDAGITLLSTKGLYYEWLRTVERANRCRAECTGALGVPSGW